MESLEIVLVALVFQAGLTALAGKMPFEDKVITRARLGRVQRHVFLICT